MKNKYVLMANQWWLVGMWLLSIALPTQAQTTQPPVIEWQRVVEGNNPFTGNGPDFTQSAIVKNSQGGYVVLTKDRRLLFLTTAGNIITDTPITGISTARGLAAASDGGVVVGVAQGNSGNDWSLQKRNASGAVIWTYRIQVSNPAADFYTIEDVVATPDGGFVVFGTGGYQVRGGSFQFVVAEKVDKDGVLVWKKSISFSNAHSTFANRAINTPDGGYLLVGHIVDSPVAVTLRGWSAKLDEQGNLIRQSGYNSFPYSLTDVIPNPNGNGSFIAVATNNIFTILPNGDLIPTTTRPSFESGATIASDGSGQPFFVVLDKIAQNGGDFRLTGFNQQNQEVWTRTLGGSADDSPTALPTTGDGYLLAGTTTSTDGDVGGKQSNASATWIVKLTKAAPTFLLTQPTYNCSTGAITFNTTGGDGSTITYSAPGISRSSVTSNSGTVEPGLRNDPKPITITATQNTQTASYVFDLKASCTVGGNPLAPALITSIPDFTFTVGEGVNERVDQYFNRDPQGNFRFTAGGLPPGLLFFETPSTGEVRLYSTPTATGVYTVTVTVTNPKIPSPNNSTSTTFKITVVDKPIVNPPTPPTGGTLALTQPTYNCQTGAITFNTTGGNGSSITYNAPGISRANVTDNFGTVEPGLRNDPKPITITATQNGNTVSYTFDFGAFCTGTQPPVNPPTPPVTPPTGGTLALIAPAYDCATGAFTFNTSGGNGTTIEYMAIGITGWTTNSNQFVDRDSRTANDVKPFTLMARQSGQTVTYVWDLKAACGRSQARLGTGERMAELNVVVVGNPVSEAATVEVGGAEGKPLSFRLIDARGRLVESRSVGQAGAAERQRFDLHGQGSGLLLLRVSSGTQTKTVKIIKQ